MTKHRFPEEQHMCSLTEMHVSEELVPNMLSTSSRIWIIRLHLVIKAKSERT